MNNVLFLYNDVDGFTGISSVMMVAERFAMKQDKGKFIVKAGPNPTINFEDGSLIKVLPVRQGLKEIYSFDTVYIDDTVEISDISENPKDEIKTYNRDSFI